MKLFDKLKNLHKNRINNNPDDIGTIAVNLAKNKTIKTPVDKSHNSFGEPLDKLVNGELPWGWVAAKRDFVEKIQNEFGVFLDNWIKNRGKNPRDEYASLKSLILYIKDVKKLCKSKGECYAFWCDEILATDDYLEKRISDLKYLEENMATLQEEYERRQFIESNILPNLKKELFRIVKDNPGIIQKDIYKKYDPDLKSDISSIFYFMAKEGKIIREKSGNSYKLNIK